MEVLWVRWLGINQQNKWGFKEARLPKVGFVLDRADHEPFGFLDPSLVIRGCHLIPAFSEGRTSELLQEGPSLARLPGEVVDWAGFYVNMWVLHVLGAQTKSKLTHEDLWIMTCLLDLLG